MSIRRVLACLPLLLPLLAASARGEQFETRPLALPSAFWTGDAQAVNGTLFSRVSMRKVKYARILAEAALALPGDAAAWPGGGVRRVELAGPGMGLAGFNEAQLDYLTADPARPGCLGLAVELSGPGKKEVFVSDPLETVDQLSPEWADGRGRDQVPVAHADWAPKGLRYQLARLLDREPDQLWRYSQDGLSTFVQRRFRKSLIDVGAIDVVLLRGQDVQVNLVVSLDPAGKSKTVLDWYAIPKRTFDLGDGRSILRLYVGRHLRELAPGARNVQLKEMALMFFKENQEDVVRERNVEKVIFVPSGLDASLTADGLPRDLPARAREVFTGRGELSANLQDLSRQPWKGMALASLSVLQSPQDPAEPFAQTLESARLADVAPRRDVPALLAATAERCASFGAPCDIEDPNGLVGQDPVWTLDLGPLSSQGGENGAELDPAYADKLFVSPGRLTFAPARDGLTVECQAADQAPDCSELTLETGARFTPEPGRTYSLWLELGRERRGLAGVVAEAYGDGKSATVAVKPGFPAVFSDLPPKVEGVRLRFASSGPEMSVTLRRAVLQSYAPAAPRRNLFAARYLFDEALELKPARSGKAILALEAPEVRFEPQWLILDLTTAPWSVKDESPQATLSLGGASARFPLRSPSSRVAVYLPAVPGVDARPRPGAWPRMTLSLSGGAPEAGLDCSRAVLSGQRLATWPEVLAEEPLMDLAGTGRTLRGLDAGQASRMAASSHWLGMGPVSLPAGTGPARFVKNPWLEVEALLISDASGPALAGLGEKPTPPAAKAGQAGKLLAGLATAVAFGLAWLVARQRAVGRVFSALAGWLCRESGPKSGALAVLFWLAAGLGAAGAGLVLGPGVLRLTAMLGTMLAVPLWKAFGPRAARLMPRLAKNPALHYCTGFLAASALAAVVRMTGAAPVAELFGLCGLWLFCAALACYFHHPHLSDPDVNAP